MNDSHEAIELAIQELDRLRNVLRRGSNRQVRSDEEKSLIKATILTWFKNHLPKIQESVNGDTLQEIDDIYKNLLSASDLSSSRSMYNNSLKNLRSKLSELRRYVVTPDNESHQDHTTDVPPDFSSLISDSKMQSILERRWVECRQCINSKAPLAATVMMGGFLEGLLLARINKEPNKDKIFKSDKAPKNKGGGKTLPLKEWTLRHFIDVAHDIGWISQSAKDVGEVMRDYRNYIHPQKEYSHGVQLNESDASLFWEITKNITRHLL